VKTYESACESSKALIKARKAKIEEFKSSSENKVKILNSKLTPCLDLNLKVY